MPNRLTVSPHFPIFRRLWKPAVVTGGSGTALAVWFEEIMIYADEILVLLFLSIVGGLMYLFNDSIFRSHTPRREDIENAQKKE